jgi:ribonuclease-3
MLALPPFQNAALLTQALTHRSYRNENPELTEDNERLEFLGDAILAFLIGELLYQKYPAMNEAELTRLRANLVREEQLSQLASEIGLGELMRLGKGAIKDGGRSNPTLLGDSFEAIIGAYYLDSGLNAVKDYLHGLFIPVASRLVSQQSDSPSFIDAKNLFQQWSLENFARNPEYLIIDVIGPAHAREFTAEVRINNLLYGTGKGKRKQDATKAAAEDALKRCDFQVKISGEKN